VRESAAICIAAVTLISASMILWFVARGLIRMAVLNRGIFLAVTIAVANLLKISFYVDSRSSGHSEGEQFKTILPSGSNKSASPANASSNNARRQRGGKAQHRKSR
jgi:hypothetical protein